MKSAIKKLFKDHKQELMQWIITSLIIPLIIIILTLFLVYFKDNREITTTFYTTLFNGSLPLTAINILVIGLYLVLTHSKHKEDDLNLNLSHGRFILFSALIVALITSVIFYITQAIHSYSPSIDKVDFIFQIIAPVLLILFALFISAIFFLFSEDKIQRSFGGLEFHEEKDIKSNTLIRRLLCKTSI